MTTERIALLRHLGAEVELTPGILMADAVRRAKEIADELPDAIMPDQFTNFANAELHRRTTTEKIWLDGRGEVDVFVSAVGTGGTHHRRRRSPQGTQARRPDHRRRTRWRRRPLRAPNRRASDAR